MLSARKTRDAETSHYSVTEKLLQGVNFERKASGQFRPELAGMGPELRGFRGGLVGMGREPRIGGAVDGAGEQSQRPTTREMLAGANEAGTDRGCGEWTGLVL